MELAVTLFLCGDLMLGRGVDQALAASVDPTLHESYVKDARHYVELAETESGPTDTPLSPRRLWGDALAELERRQPAARIANLETALTTSGDWDRAKGIHYRMHPENADCLTVAGIDAVVLANNHTLDWGQAALIQTLGTLETVGVQPVGAGRDAEAAEAPAVIELGNGRRLLVFAAAHPSSGVPEHWAAQIDQPGLFYLPALGDAQFERVKRAIERRAKPDDIVLFSIHWGGNWGYDIPDEQRQFALRLVEEAGVSIVHGHSSHHVKGLEIRNGRLVLYGAGDFLNDYEGIDGYEEYRPDLSLMYFPEVDASGKLRRLTMTPMQIRRFSLRRATREDARWLAQLLQEASAPNGLSVETTDDGRLHVLW